MALTTDFDILVKHKGKDEGRKEKRPLFFTVIHSIPKQISDTSQSIGINERTRKNGLMSGVILPSQIAHDRWLSIYDAIFDSVFIFIVLLIISYFNLNIFSIIALLSIFTYMFFHIFWWENSIQWYFIETIIDYVKKTRRYYYSTFILIYLMLSIFGYFISYKYDLKYYILLPIIYYDKTVSYIHNNSFFNEKIKNLDVTFQENSYSRFSTQSTLKKEKLKSDDIVVNNEKNITSNKTILTEITLDYFIRYIVLNLGFLIYFYFVFNYANNYYIKKKEDHLDGVDVELKTDLERKMEEIKKLF